MGKIFALVFVVLMGSGVVVILDAAGAIRVDRWFDDWGGSSYVEGDDVDYIVARWNEYFTYKDGNWEEYVPSQIVGEDVFDYVGQVVWIQWNWVVVEIRGEEIKVSHYKL